MEIAPLLVWETSGQKSSIFTVQLYRDNSVFMIIYCTNVLVKSSAFSEQVARHWQFLRLCMVPSKHSVARAQNYLTPCSFGRKRVATQAHPK